MKNEIERLMRDRNIPTQSKQKTLTENLKEWRKDRNITKASYYVFIENILEELLEPLYGKDTVNIYKKKILKNYFPNEILIYNNEDIIDAIKDIKVFCINETELMGYDDAKTDSEVFKHINCRKQDPIQKEQWEKFGAYGKWEKDKNQDPKEIYEPEYASCKCSK